MAFPFHLDGPPWQGLCWRSPDFFGHLRGGCLVSLQAKLSLQLSQLARQLRSAAFDLRFGLHLPGGSLSLRCIDQGSRLWRKLLELHCQSLQGSDSSQGGKT
jgi:hypothetical protein